MKVMKTIGMFTLVSLVGCGNAKKGPSFQGPPVKNDETRVVVPTEPAKPTDPVVKNDLPLMDGTHELKMEKLPLDGSVEVEGEQRFWSGDHWASSKGLINRRWNTPEQQGFELVSPTKEELALMTPDDVARLSPTEKYDLLKGQYEYPLKKEVEKKASPLAVYWEGIGNGWAVATLNHPEPKPKVLTNPEGLVIPFGSDDIKALLSYYYAVTKELPKSIHLGFRCKSTRETSAEDENCHNDLNAGAFHVALTNLVGIEKKSFLMDLDRYQEVWNHPVQAYRTEVLEKVEVPEDAAKGTKEVLRMKTRVSYVDAATGNSWETIKGSYRQVTSNRVYHYDLYLNKEGEVIGGKWTSNDRPDFIWNMPGVENFEGPLDGLKVLLE